MAALGRHLRTLEGDKIGFWCPGCGMMHAVRIKGADPWKWNGSADRPTFSPSVHVSWFLLSPEGEEMIRNKVPLPEGQKRYPGKDMICHTFVTDGQIQFLSDCTHALAGQTVPLPDFPT